jgi:hypothetical protein
MVGEVRQVKPPWRRGGGDDFDVRVAVQRRRRSDYGVVRSGKAKDAMAARSMDRRIDRQGRGGRGAAVQAQLEARRRAAIMGGKGKPAECDEETLCGDGIGDDDPDQGPPKSLGPSAKSAHVHAYPGKQYHRIVAAGRP